MASLFASNKAQDDDRDKQDNGQKSANKSSSDANARKSSTTKPIQVLTVKETETGKP